MRGLLHRVVWFAARGPIPAHLEINHIDGNKLNNAVSNLECTTPAENTAHARNLGLTPPRRRGVFRGWKARLEDEHVREIRARAEYESQAALAKHYNISQSQISRVITRTSYKYVE